MTFPTFQRPCGMLGAVLVAVGTLAVPLATAADEPVRIAQLSKVEAAPGSAHGLTPTEALVARITVELRREARAQLSAHLVDDLAATLDDAKVIAD